MPSWLGYSLSACSVGELSGSRKSDQPNFRRQRHYLVHARFILIAPWFLMHARFSHTSVGFIALTAGWFCSAIG